MVQMVSFVAEMLPSRWLPLFVVLILFGALSSGCGDESAADEGEVVLTAEEAKEALRGLPYHYDFIKVKVPEGATAAVAARAHGKHDTRLTFGASFGDHSKPVTIPHVQLGDIAGTPYFTYSSNLQEPTGDGHWKRGKQFRTAAQWNEAINMVFDMEQAFCKAATGEPCPI
jgi:hypothetical protein